MESTKRVRGASLSTAACSPRFCVGDVLPLLDGFELNSSLTGEDGFFFHALALKGKYKKKMAAKESLHTRKFRL
jgi:hypothetical protein